MKLRIAIADNPLTRQWLDFSKFANSEHQIMILPESQCSEYLINNRADAAVLSPLGYNAGVDKSDLRIVPISAISLEGYTNTVGFYIKPAIKTIHTAHFKTNSDIIKALSLAALGEKFDISPEITSESDCSAVVDWAGENAGESTLDFSEEWSDTFNFKAPLFFWGVRNEEYDNTDVPAILKQLEFNDISAIEIADNNDEYRQGKISYIYDDDFENALEETLELLFCRQEISEIGAVKIYGVEPPEDEL